MELVRRLLTTQPNITALNLEFSEIDSLDALLPLLARFPRLQQLDLSGNRLTALPSSLSGLKELQYLNLTNNLFEDCERLIPALQTLPQLVELAITVNGERDEQLLLSALPRLQVLNDLQSSVQETSKSRLQQEDLEQVAQLYDEVRGAWKLEDTERDEDLGEAFDQHVKEVMNALYEGVQRTPALEPALMVQAKFDLYEVCFHKVVDLVQMRDANVGGILQKVKQAHAQMISALVEIAASSVPTIHEQLQQASADTQKAQRETAEVLEAAEQLETEHFALKEELVRSKATWDAEKAELMTELEELKAENQRCLDALIKHSKNTAAHALAKEQDYPRANSTIPKALATTQMTAGRVLSLKQLKDVIEEIYASKAKFDQKCKETQLPRETMEQHMYSFLNKKYGLKVRER